jgi:hypothetical protein
LVEKEGEVSIGVEGTFQDLYEGFLMGGGDHQLFTRTILESHHIAIDPQITATLPPELPRSDQGNRNLLPSQSVHLFPDDSLYVPQNPDTEGKNTVQPLTQGSNVASFQQKHRAGRPDILRNFSKCFGEEAAIEHISPL